MSLHDWLLVEKHYKGVEKPTYVAGWIKYHFDTADISRVTGLDVIDTPEEVSPTGGHLNGGHKVVLPGVASSKAGALRSCTLKLEKYRKKLLGAEYA